MNETKQIPLLKANDIECRVQQVKKGYCGEVEATILLYKDARCDMKYLDLLFGMFGWKREHTLKGDRLYCTVSIYDEVNSQWISKEDVGTESNTEKEKGQASDAFKRACTNIGLGRELYTAPLIKIRLDGKEYKEYTENGKEKIKCFQSFSVNSIEYNQDREISSLVIVDRFDRTRFVFSEINQETDYRKKFINLCIEKGIEPAKYATENGVTKATTQEEYRKICERIENGLNG